MQTIACFNYTVLLEMGHPETIFGPCSDRRYLLYLEVRVVDLFLFFFFNLLLGPGPL